MKRFFAYTRSIVNVGLPFLAYFSLSFLSLKQSQLCFGVTLVTDLFSIGFFRKPRFIILLSIFGRKLN